MPDPIDPKLLQEPPAEAATPAGDEDAVAKTTHEVDADDMFGSTT